MGTYTFQLFEAMSRISPGDPDLVATAFSARTGSGLRHLVPPRVRIAGRRAPARLLRRAWANGQWPPVELLSGRVDVFHGTNFVAPPTHRAARVVTVHDLAYLLFPETVDHASLVYRRLVPRALSQGAIVCAVSDTMAHAIIDTYGLAPEQVHTTRLGVDPTWLSVASAGDQFTDSSSRLPSPSLPNDYIVAVGTLEPRKNLVTLLSAYRLASVEGIDLPPLVLIGAEGWGAALDLEGISPGSVIRTGHLPLSMLQRTVASARLLVFPSLYEGFGLPPLEALACGVPVVASDLEVTREVLGPLATLAPPGSPADLLAAVMSALEHPAGSADSRRAHAATFTWEECARSTLRAYADAARR